MLQLTYFSVRQCLVWSFSSLQVSREKTGYVQFVVARSTHVSYLDLIEPQRPAINDRAYLSSAVFASCTRSFVQSP